MFCPKCGLELPEEANFCLKCGCEVSKYKTPFQKNTDSPDKTLGNVATINESPSDSLSKLDTVGPTGPSAKDSPRYEILSTIGQGGMGVVYKAQDNRLRRVVALKRLRSNLSDFQNAIDRFFNEAKSIATLNHQNIVQIYDYGEDVEGHYIAMEYVDGITMKDYLGQKGKLNAEEATRIILSLARGLATAHGRGVIHRDIKPGNILLDKSNKAKLTDFGLARVADSEDITRTGFMMGTPDYCSPEQLRDAKNVDHRTDIYSLGATFYEMVAGQSPKYFREEYPPGGIQPLIKKAMSSDPKRRYQTVWEFIEAFEGEAEEETTSIKIACPQCGLRNPTDVKFCVKCGNSLSHLFDKCPKCQRENRVDVEYCGGCGYNIYNHRRIQKLTDKALKLREQQEYTEAIGNWEKILEIEPDNQNVSNELLRDKEAIQSIEKLCRTLEENKQKRNWQEIVFNIKELEKLSKDRVLEFKNLRAETEAYFQGVLKASIGKDDYQTAAKMVEMLLGLNGEAEELKSLLGNYKGKANKEARLNEANEVLNEFKHGKKTISDAIEAWGQYLNVAETTEERSLAEQTLKQLKQEKTKLLKLLKQKELDYENALQRFNTILSTNLGNIGIQEEMRKASEILEPLKSEIQQLMVRLEEKEKPGEVSQSTSDEEGPIECSETGSNSVDEQVVYKSFFGTIFLRVVMGGLVGVIFGIISGVILGKFTRDGVMGMGIGGAIIGFILGLGKWSEIKRQNNKDYA